MAIEKIDNSSLWAKADSDVKKKKKEQTGDFRAILSDTIDAEWNSFVETGLTPADQLVKAIGGERALEAKRALQRERDEKAEAKKDEIQRKSAGSVSTNGDVETITKQMGDGSIMVITTEGGKIVEQYRKKPHLAPEVDVSRPMKLQNGKLVPQMKWVPKQSLAEELFS